MTSEWELLPCPFCGEQPEWKRSTSEDDSGKTVVHHRLACLDRRTRCHTRWYTDETRAVGAWNGRDKDDDQG
jgi:hypothetical protein